MIALMAALTEEVRPLRREMAATRRVRWGSIVLWEGRYGGQEVVLVRSGVGKERAAHAAGSILKRYPVTAVVSFGFGGGAQAGMAPGEVVVCPQVYALEETPGRETLLGPVSSHPGLLESALRLLDNHALPGRAGAGLTVATAVAEPERKARLGGTHGIQVLDMESYWVAAQAQEKGVSFLAIRSIVDPLEERLPRSLDRLASGGWPCLWGILANLSRPWEASHLLKAWGNSRCASRSLGLFLKRLVSEIPHAGAEGMS